MIHCPRLFAMAVVFNGLDAETMVVTVTCYLGPSCPGCSLHACTCRHVRVHTDTATKPYTICKGPQKKNSAWHVGAHAIVKAHAHPKKRTKLSRSDKAHASEKTFP